MKNRGQYIDLDPDSPDEMAFGQLRAPISVVRSNSYAGSSSRILTDPTGEKRNRQFCQHFRGLRFCRPNPSGESGINVQEYIYMFMYASVLTSETLDQQAIGGPAQS